MNRTLGMRLSRGALAAVGAVAVFATTAAPASAGVTPADGPPPAGSAVQVTEGFDFDRFGYDLAEFFVDGDARSYHDVEPLTADGHWSVEADGTLRRSRRASRS
jgi:hypothetical protein